MGVCYTVGSWFFLRGVKRPRVEPIFKDYYHLCTDELVAMWLYFLGTLPAVPICAMYTYFNQEDGTYGLALALSIIVSIITELAVFATYPPRHGKVREYVSKILLIISCCLFYFHSLCCMY